MKVEGFPCQKVCGAQETEITLRTRSRELYFGDLGRPTIKGSVKPAGIANVDDGLKLSYCYYKKLENGSCVINRGYYMTSRRYEISLRVLKNISQVSAANE